MSDIFLHHNTGELEGDIFLDGSKSISNRALIISQLMNIAPELIHLSTSEDTKTLQSVLNSNEVELDCHHAGTTFRFMTAYLAIQGKKRILTGSSRMKQRPIGALVDALRQLGAKINYLENEGFPPLEFNGFAIHDYCNTIQVNANISSQYITALLLIAPTLPQGLVIQLVGESVSFSYLQMTISLMEQFGVKVGINHNTITVISQTYQCLDKSYTIESDWSAASYYVALAALSKKADLRLYGLNSQSTQGDSVSQELGQRLGLKCYFDEKEVLHIIKDPKRFNQPTTFEHNFINCPDIAQTFAVIAAGLGITSIFSGLQTLSIKETDRILALQIELAKVQSTFTKLPNKFSQLSKVAYWMIEGKSAKIGDQDISIDTYQDHRMAMSFAPLALLFPIRINESEVIAKSYPTFWEDMKTIGFEITTHNLD